MSTDQTFQTDPCPPLMRTLSVGGDCESLLDFDHLGNRFEWRVLQLGEWTAKTVERVSRQLSLIALSDHQAIRGVLRPLTTSTPRSFALTLAQRVHPLDDRLDRVIPTLQSEERIEIASQVIEALAAAHHLGLCHGSLAPATILIERGTAPLSIYLDFSATTFDPTFNKAITSDSLSVEHDLAALRSLLKWLLLPVIDSQEELASFATLGGRERAMLRRWLTDEHSLPPTIGQWQSVLPKRDQPRAPTIDQTGVVDLKQVATQDGRTANIENVPLELRATSNSIPKKLGRFQIEEKIGQGGMGAVYRAKDLSDGQIVALKVLTNTGTDISQSIRRFRKEARLLADVGNDHVTRLIDVGEDQGTHYLAMEFIDGIDLKRWLEGRGPLPEQVALQITADLARALVEAHSREVVHRDIKPENVLLQIRDDVDASPVPLQQRPISGFIVKLSDFGIARHVTQSESMEMTRAGAILGTPKYMSPEQCKSAEDIGPAADVYSLGITMFQLLTGKVPFESDDFMKLAAMHCFDKPPSVQKRIAEVSDMTARIVDRALAKSPTDRYGDASQMLTELLRAIRGDAAAVATHPRLPDHDANRLWEKTVSWELASQPHELWPLVSNTERLNEAIGLPAVHYTSKKDPELGLRKFGSFKLSGVTVSWEEHPFEWIEGRRMGILRQFDSGPFKWFMSVVTLEDRPGAGTRLSHQVRIEPRNLMGRALTTIEADWKGFKSLKRVYERMDRTIQARSQFAATIDPFSDVKPPSKACQSRIDQRIEKMLERGADNDCAEALRTVLQGWASQELSHLRPLDMADRLSVDGGRMIEACLIAAREGLLSLRWDILCPTCRVAAATTALLSEIDSHTHCEACDYDFKSNLGDAIEMVFQAHCEIREINQGQYCIGGPEHSPHVVAQVRLKPGECLELEVNLAPGEYLLRGPRLARNGRIRVETKSAPSFAEFTLSSMGGSHTSKLRAGKQTITLANDLPTLHVVRIERTIPRDDVVTAGMASTNATFRRLFPDQNIATKTPIETDTVSFLATAISNVDHLYQTLGDSAAYATIQGHHRKLSGTVTTCGGTIVKTVGERMLAAFPRREQAVEAAILLQQELAEEPSASIELGIGVHCGPTLVTTQNNQLDYFGGTVRAVFKLPELAGRDTLITEPVYSDEVVRSHFTFQESRLEMMDLPGSPGTRCKRVITEEKTKP